MEEIKNIELIDEKFEVEFNLIYDFKIMYELVKWSDSFTRMSRDYFHIVKDFVGYSLYFVRQKDLPNYIRRMIVMVRKPKHRLDYENKKIQEFKDMILKKYSKGFGATLKPSLHSGN